MQVFDKKQNLQHTDYSNKTIGVAGMSAARHGQDCNCMRIHVKTGIGNSCVSAELL